MQNWEYLQMTIVYGKRTGTLIFLSKGQPPLNDDNTLAVEVKDFLDVLGADGWEMVNVYQRYVNDILNETYYFKRLI